MDQSTQQGETIHDRIMAKLEPQPEPVQEEEAEDEQSIQSEPETEESTEVEAEAETEEESEVSDEEQEEPTDDEQTSLTTTELSKVLGFEDDDLDLDEDGNVLIKTKIDGEEGKAKLKDLVVSYQLRGHLDKQNKEVAEIKKSLQEQTAKVAEEATQRLTQLESMLHVAWSELEQQLESPEMAELREADPAEWTARNREMDSRKQRIADTYQAVLAEKQAETQKFTQLDQTKINEILMEEDKKLRNAIEGWDNDEIARKELNDVMSYLKNDYSYTDEDLYGVRDAQGNFIRLGIANHKAVVLARKAMLYDKLQQSKPTVSKKVKSAPKIVKPGQPKPKESTQTKVQKLKQAVKESGGKGKSVAEYLLATGKV